MKLNDNVFIRIFSNEGLSHNILVIGDVMLDSYIYGDVDRISPEAPVPILKKVSNRFVLGGASNVAANLVAARQNVTLLSIIGADEAGETITQLGETLGLRLELFVDSDRPTCKKTRFVSSTSQQIFRCDEEKNDDIDDSLCQSIITRVNDIISDFDIIVLSDYCKGLLTNKLTRTIIDIANSNNVPVVIDVKDADLSKYSGGALLLKPNKKELKMLSGMPVSNLSEIERAARKIIDITDCCSVLVTCGEDGMVLVDKTGVKTIPAEKVEVYDVTGAGDTTIAYMAVGIANGLSIYDSAHFSTIPAAIQVSKLGTSAITLDEVQKYIQNDNSSNGKLISAEKLTSLRDNNKDRTIVFTNGCFDILHAGHVRYLREAAKAGDILVLGLNSDASVKRLKGDQRPINNEQDRAELLGALEFIDYIVIFNEDTPYSLVQALQPDVLVKGSDYKVEDIAGSDIVINRGGKVVLVPLVENKSTTNVIQKIKNQF